MNKQFLFFDLDGTITDSKPGIINSVKYSLDSFGIGVENSDDLIPFIGPPLKESFKKYCGFEDETADKAVKRYREYFSEKGIFENALYPDMDAILYSLYKKGKTMIVATSKATVFAERIIKHFKLDKYFTFISGSELDGRRSKKYEVIKFALDTLEITGVCEAVMIGDREHDIIGAREAGMDSVGVLYGYGSLGELQQAGATHIVSTVNELHTLLGNQDTGS